MTLVTLISNFYHFRRQIKRKTEKKVNKNPKAKKIRKKSSEATALFTNCISKSSGDDDIPSKNLFSPKPAKITPRNSSVKPSQNKVYVDARSLTWSLSPQTTCNVKSKKKASKYKSVPWINVGSYSSSEESELEDVFVPSKIWVKPSARPMLPTLSKLDTETHGISQRARCNNTSTLRILQPIISIKRMHLSSNTKYDNCDDEVPSRSEFKTTRNVLNTNCCLQWQKLSQSCGASTTEIPCESDKEDPDSEESVDEKYSQHLMTTANQFLEDIEKGPSNFADGGASSDLASPAENVEISGMSGNLGTTEDSSSQCSYQLADKPRESITTASQTNDPETSTRSTLPVNESPARISSLTTVCLVDVSTAESNQNDDTILSPVIFDELSATQNVDCEVASPVIFGSNEGIGAESGDIPYRSNNQHQKGITNERSSSSSGFILELLASEQSDIEASIENCDVEPTSDISTNFNLQLSQNLSHQNFPRGVSSQEFISSSSFTLEIPPDGLREDSSDEKNSQLSSCSENVLCSRTEQGSSSDMEAPSNLFGFEMLNISESKKMDQPTKEAQNLFENKKIYLSSLSEKQNVFSETVMSPNQGESQKILLVKRSQNLPHSEKAPGLSGSQIRHLSTSKASQFLKSGESSLSGLKAPNISETSTSHWSTTEVPSVSCMSISQVANIPKTQKNCFQPLKILNTLGSQESNSLTIQGSNLPISVSTNRNDAFTQTDLQEVLQQPSQLSVNYIINSSGHETIRFEGPVVNHPSTMSAVSKNIQAGNSTFIADHCRGICSLNQTKRIPCHSNVGNIFHHSEIYDLPESNSELEKSSAVSTCAISNSSVGCSSSTVDYRITAEQPCRDEDATKNMIDFIDLTNDDESKCGEPQVGKMRLKTPSELGCTIAFSDDVERLFRYELPKLSCDFQKLDLLKEKYFNIFKLVLAKCIHGKTVNDTLQELYNTRSVPCGFNLLRNSPPLGFASVQMSARSLAAQSSTRPNLRNGSFGPPRGISNHTHDPVR